MIASLSFVFFVSGAGVLVFETLWFRQAGLMLGNSVWTSSIVTASFMAGLALGNGAAARFGMRLKRPVAAYAILEIVIGTTGLGLVFLFPTLTPLTASFMRRILEYPALLNGLRLTTAFTLMLVPTTAMGMTLPILVRALTARESDFGRALGWLYGWNTLGAVVGALLGEVVLLGRLGIRGTSVAAASLNALAACGAFVIARGGSFARNTPEGATATKRSPFEWRQKLLLAAAFASGAILLALEVVWFRFLLLFVYGHSLTFAIMLAVVLLGIGLGGLGASWCLKYQPTAARWLAAVALASGIATIYPYLTFGDFMRAHADRYLYQIGPIIAASARLMLPTSLLSGLIFTFIGKALKHERDEESRTGGALAMSNTIGAMLGALVAAFLLLPRLGIEKSLMILAASYCLVALLAIWASARRPTRGELSVLIPTAMVFAACVILFPFGLMNNRYIRSVASRLPERSKSIVAIREGLNETIILLRIDRWGEPYYYLLLTNGFSMSGTRPDAHRYMKLFVYWANAVCPQAKTALLISYGVGSTASALVDTKTLERIDIVDTSREILETSRLVFPPGASHPLDDSRAHVTIEDGRFFLLTTNRSYDIITGEPPPPKMAGIVSLYTKEYFRLIHDRLAPGGAATYWLPIRELSLTDSKSIIGAFCAAFDDCSLWLGSGTHWMLAGTRHATGPVKEEDFIRQWRDATVAQTMRAVGFEGPEQIGALMIADDVVLRRFIRGVPALDDDHPLRLSSKTQLHLDAELIRFASPQAMKTRFASSAFIKRLWPKSVRRDTLAAFDVQNLFHQQVWALRRFGSSGIRELSAILNESRYRYPVLLYIGTDEKECAIARIVASRVPLDAWMARVLAADDLAGRRYLEAARRFQEAARLSSRPEAEMLWRTLSLLQAGDRHTAADVMKSAAQSTAIRYASEWEWLARAHDLPWEGVAARHP